MASVIRLILKEDLDNLGSIGDVVRGVRESFSNVVCVDDGSTDATVDLARESGATVLSHVNDSGFWLVSRLGHR